MDHVFRTAGKQRVDRTRNEIAGRERLASVAGEGSRERYAQTRGLSAAVRYVAIAVLPIVATGFGSNDALYDVLARFIVTAGAFFIALHAFRSAAYAIAVVFGLVALLYNPIAPVFEFTGDWQCVTVLGTAVLFIVSFYWRFRLAHHA